MHKCTTIQYPAFIVKPEADPGEGMGPNPVQKIEQEKIAARCRLLDLMFDGLPLPIMWLRNLVLGSTSKKIRQKFSINEGQQSLLSVCFHGKFCTVLEVKCCHK